MGKRLERLRKSKKLTLRELAQRVGVPVTTYRDWEYGSEIKGEPYLKLAEALGVSLYELLGSEATHSHKGMLAKLKALKTLIESMEKDAQSLF